MMNEFEKAISKYNGIGLKAIDLEILQVNIGLKCNQHCQHCHLGSSPDRKEMMDWETMECVVNAAERMKVHMVDITGGSPEIHPHIKPFIQSLVERGIPVKVRTNLTILQEPEYQDLSDFFKEQKVQLVASLPCYLEENVDRQRGKGAYGKSIETIRMLNSLGYGVQPQLSLNLVYNPGGPFLPPSQSELEAAYKRELDSRFGIHFNHLLTMTNMPMGRFLSQLEQERKDKEYRQLLKEKFNPATLQGLMCRHQINVGWDGTLYDCDFNLALKMPVMKDAPQNIQEIDPDRLLQRRIVTECHCFGCTAGSGSSCAGALAE
jgi:radical SAM/Cys-rich protein